MPVEHRMGWVFAKADRRSAGQLVIQHGTPLDMGMSAGTCKIFMALIIAKALMYI